VVAIGAHKFTGVTLSDVDDLLTGLPAPKIKFQFDAGDPYIGSQTVDWRPIPPWDWPTSLSGVLWIDNQPPFRVTARPNPSPAWPMPPELCALRGADYAR
jgi:hypothetical protein